jgi:hypothetical protein
MKVSRARAGERYTLPADVERARTVAGVQPFELDAAACAEAHHAPAWFVAPWAYVDGAAGVDGLRTAWYGSVWCNPPFDDLAAWVQRAWQEASSHCVRSIVMLVPANRTGTRWWQGMVEPYRERQDGGISLRTHFLPGRLRFGGPGAPTTPPRGTPPFACALLVWKRVPA